MARILGELTALDPITTVKKPFSLIISEGVCIPLRYVLSFHNFSLGVKRS
jgi:hypothetical protein